MGVVVAVTLVVCTVTAGVVVAATLVVCTVTAGVVVTLTLVVCTVIAGVVVVTDGLHRSVHDKQQALHTKSETQYGLLIWPFA